MEEEFLKDFEKLTKRRIYPQTKMFIYLTLLKETLMKKRFLSLIFFTTAVLLPSVSAQESVLDYFLGSSEESILFLKLMYGLFVYLIFFQGAKQTMFREAGQRNLAIAFSLILAFFVIRFTSDALIQKFGWVTMVLAPFTIIFFVTGLFVRRKPEEQQGTPWVRLLIATISTIILFIALGSYSGFSSGVGSVPVGGGFLDELFADANYLIFYKLDWFIALFIAGAIIALLILLLSRISWGRDRTGQPSGFFGGFWGPLLAILGIIAAIILLIYLFSGNGLGFIGALGAIPVTGLLTYLAILLGIFLLLPLLFLFFKFKGWKLITGAGYLTGQAIWWVLRKFLAFDRWGTPLITGPLGWILRWPFRGGRLFVDIQTPTERIIRKGTLHITAGSRTPITFTLYRGGFYRTAQRLPGAELQFTVAPGTVQPQQGTTNQNGQIQIVYTAPPATATGTLRATVLNPQAVGLRPSSRIPDIPIQIGIPSRQLRVVIPPIAPIPAGAGARITINIDDGTGTGANGVMADLLFTRHAIGPFRRTSAGGGPGAPSFVIIDIPPTTAGSSTFPTAGQYDFIATLTPPAGYAAPKLVPGQITVTSAPLQDLEIIGLQCTVGGRTTPAPKPVDVYIGGRLDIELTVRAPRGGSGTDSAKVQITSPTGVMTPTSIGSGRYKEAITAPTTPGTLSLTVEATQPGFNPARERIDINVLPLPTEMLVIVNWVPELTTIYALMNFIVLDRSNGTPINGAEILIADRDTPQVDITGELVTNANGQLPNPLRIDLGRRTATTTEHHNLDITVTCTGYPPKQRPQPITVTFQPPGSPLGSPRTEVF